MTPPLSPGEARFEALRRRVGLVLGPALFALLLAGAPRGLSPSAGRLSAVLAWALVWWITEAIPIPVTAVLAPALGVLLGVGEASELFAPFADPIVFLFLGSFVLAEAMSDCGLDRRVAYAVLSSRSVGSSTVRILLAVVGLVAGLSMWLSNTAAAAIAYPIALSLLRALSRHWPEPSGAGADLRRTRYGVGLMLGLAYAASIGGIATPVGTPPNLIAAGQLARLAGVRLGFFQWMGVALPAMALLLAILVVYLLRVLPPEVGEIPGAAELVSRGRASLGPIGRRERNVLAAFALTVSLWILPGVVAAVAGPEAPVARALARQVPESVAALFGAGLLFVLPVDWRRGEFTLSWREAARIDWGTLLLFGGGLSLGAAMNRTGLAEEIGRTLVAVTDARSLLGLTYLFSGLAILLTETTSNTAAATIVCPLAIAAAQAAGASPVPPAIGAALGASMAFMLPISTPPNAIVYGSGCLRIAEMARHGAALDLASALVVPPTVVVPCRLLGLA